MQDIFEKVLAGVPAYEHFLSVGEMDVSAAALAAEFPDVVELMVIGRSTEGSPINCLKIRGGPKNALAYGCPHPNEPMGAMSMEYFSRALAENKDLREALGYTWYIVKCSDPDGTRLNEEWFHLPLTIYNFARNVYRPAAFRQVEWTFPIHYKNHNFEATIPETQALMTLIEDIKPEFIYSLHNCMFGGAYWYLLNPMPEDAYEALRESARKRGIALRLGEPESPSCQMLSPAVYRHTGAREQYDFYERLGCAEDFDGFLHGTNVVDIARENGARNILLSEIPLFYSVDAENERESEIERGDSLQEGYALNEHCMAFVKNTLRQYGGGVPQDNVFLICLQERLDTWVGNLTASKTLLYPADERRATVSEIFINRYETLLFNMITIGMLVRMFEQELSACTGAALQKQLTEGQALAEAELLRLNELLENGISYQSLPICRIIQVMLEDLFIVTQAMREEEGRHA